MGRRRPVAYTVRLSKRFEADVARVFGGFERWDEIADALYRVLPMNPHGFPDVPGTPFRAVTVITPERWTVYFWINEDDECVEFEGIR